MIRFDKAMLFLPLLKPILSVRLSTNTRGLEVLLFYEFINIVSIFIIGLIWLCYYTLF